MTYYKIIQGKYFDAALLEKGETLTKGRGDGRISLEDAQKLYQESLDGQEITEIEKFTLTHLYQTLTWTDKAKSWINEQVDFLKTENEEAEGAVFRSFFEIELRRYWQARYEAHLKDEELDQRFWEKYQIDRNMILPVQIRASIDFYLQGVEQADFGTVRLFFVPHKRFIDLSLDIKNENGLFVVRVTTDGDDGWAELFDHQGEPVGFGRTYIELIYWGEQDEIRTFVQNSGLPQRLKDRQNETLWGK